MECQECLRDGFFGAIIFMASLHGLLLALILFFSQKLSSRPTRFLALTLLGMCVILVYEAAAYVGADSNIPWFIQYLPIYIRTTIPIGLFYFVVFLIDPHAELSNVEKLGFVAIAIEVVIESAYIPVNLWVDNAAIPVYEAYISNMGEGFGIIISMVVFPLAIYRVRLYQKYLYDHYSTTSGKSLKWLNNFLLLAFATVLGWMVSYIQLRLGFTMAHEYTFAIVTVSLVMLLFWIGYFIILQYRWFEIVPYTKPNDGEDAQSNRLSAKTDVYHSNLMELMRSERLYEDIDLTLDSLSERLEISSGYLSQIINEKEDKSFFEFVNHYRVEAVKEKLLNSAFQHYTLMGMALESGFKSKSTFHSVFKKFTGHTPSNFRKLHL